MNLQQTEQVEQQVQPLQAVAPQEAPVEYWIERLASRNPAERAEAAQRVRRGDPATIQALIATLERENRKKRIRFGIGAAVAIVIILAIQTGSTAVMSGHFNITGTAWIAGIAIGAAVAPTRLQKAVARVLAEQDEIRAVGPLCEALDRQDDATKRLASSALTRLLPRLKATDADLLSPYQRAMLWKALLKTRDADLARGIINAALQTGDEKALAAVERVAKGKGPGRKNAELQGEAESAIPGIKVRAAEERVRMTLLRPAESPDSPESVLLRPAQGAESSAADVLLRPAESAADGP